MDDIVWVSMHRCSQKPLKKDKERVAISKGVVNCLTVETHMDRDKLKILSLGYERFISFT